MEELISKLNEVKDLMNGLNVLTCRIEEDGVSILVNSFSDIPNEIGVEYHKRDTRNNMCYEKSYVKNGAVIHTYGTKADMMNEFSEEEK